VLSLLARTRLPVGMRFLATLSALWKTGTTKPKICNWRPKERRIEESSSITITGSVTVLATNRTDSARERADPQF
jgi:hypothetical protein